MKTIFTNYIFLHRRMKEVLGKKEIIKYYFFKFLFAFFISVQSLLFIYLPAYIVRIILNVEDFKMLLLLVILLGISTILKDYTHNRSSNIEFIFRLMDSTDTFLYISSLRSEVMNSREGDEIYSSAGKALYYGDTIGTQGFLLGFWNIVISIIILIIYFLISAKLPFIWVMAIILPSLFKGYLDSRALLNISEVEDRMNEAWGELNYYEKSSLSNENGKDARLYNLKELFFKKMKETSKRWSDLLRSFQNKLFKNDVFTSILLLIRDVLILYYLINKTLKDGKVDEFILYLGVINSFSSSFILLFSDLTMLRSNSEIVTKYRGIFGRKIYSEGNYSEHLKEGDLEIELRNLSYKYPFTDEYVIRNLNLKLNKGQSIALVGENGAGKTTLVNLICGILVPTEGQVLYNGVDISKVNPKEIYEKISLVFQDTVIFAYSIKENISMTSSDKIDDRKIREVAQKSGIADYIETLENGYETSMLTYLDKNGVTLSGGQNQKLMLARALYKGGSLTILDEPTSALDPLAERQLYEEYLKYIEDKLSIFISHRLSSTQFCDRVLLLQNGTVVEDGTHMELMKKGGPYRSLFNLQARYYREQKEIEEFENLKFSEEVTDKKEVIIYGK